MLFFSTEGYGYSKRLCEDILIWFCKEFFSDHEIDIMVKHRGMIREGVYGWCDILDNDKLPRAFLIEIHSNLDKVTYATTLIHELIHVKQWVYGSLKMKKGKRFYKGIHVDKFEYLDQPHEVEAYAKEEYYLFKYLCRSFN